MATYKSEQLRSGNRNGKPARAELGLNQITCRYKVTAAMSAGDVIQMCPVPKGALILDTILYAQDMDGTSGSIEYGVGDGSNKSRYISGSTVGQSGGRDVMDASNATKAVAYTSADDTIDIVVSTAATTSTETGKYLQLTVLYDMNGDTPGTGV